MMARIAAVTLGVALVSAFVVADGLTFQRPTIQDEGVTLGVAGGLSMSGTGITCNSGPGYAACKAQMAIARGTGGEVLTALADAGYGNGRTFKISSDGFPNFSPLALQATQQGDGGMLSMLGRSSAGKPLVSTQQWGTYASPTAIQDGLSSAQMLSVTGTGTLGTLSQVGLVASATGAEVTVTTAGTNGQTAAQRNAYATGTAALSVLDVFATTPIGWRGNDAGLGGFFCSWDFFVSMDGGAVSTMKGFVGLAALASAYTDSAFASGLDVIGFGVNANQWTPVGNDDAGTVVYGTTCGTSFSATTEANTYRATIYAPPNASSITLELRRIDSGGKNTDSVVCVQTLTTNIPGNTSFLRPHASVGNGSAGGLVVLNFLKQYCQVPY